MANSYAENIKRNQSKNVTIERGPTKRTPFDRGDGDCVGKINEIRFNTGPRRERMMHSTVIGISGKQYYHNTIYLELRMPLYRAYKERSIIKVEIPFCKNSNINFNSFTVLKRRSR